MKELIESLQVALKEAQQFKDCGMSRELYNRILNAYNYAIDLEVMIESCPK